MISDRSGAHTSEKECDRTTSEITRRRMLAASAAVASCISTTALYAGREFTGPNPRFRKDVRDLSADEIKKYREAVRRMKAKGPDVPTWAGTQLTLPSVGSQNKQGYAFQALLHTEHCPHGNWWFLPWHRIYLFYYEEVLRALAADFMPDVALAIPYWNWTEQRAVPPIFADAPDNPLFDSRRHPRPLNDEDVGRDTINSTVHEVHTFEGFGSSASCSKEEGPGTSEFEGGPHGIVHVKIGWHKTPPAFFPCGDLRIPPTAAFDPLFWSHHANIDRLWDAWLAGNANHQNPAFDQPCSSGSDVTWGNMKFTEFVAGDGSSLSRTVQEFLEDPNLIAVQYLPKQSSITAAEPIRTGRMPQAERDDKKKQSQRVAADMQLKLGEPLTLSIPLNADLKERLSSIVKDKNKSAHFRVLDIKINEEESPSLIVRAYLNKEDVTVATDPKDPHSIGYFTFFGAGHGHKPHKDDDKDHARHGFNALLNLAPTLRRLKEGEGIGDRASLKITLLLQPVDPDAPAASEPVKLSLSGGQLELP